MHLAPLDTYWGAVLGSSFQSCTMHETGTEEGFVSVELVINITTVAQHWQEWAASLVVVLMFTVQWHLLSVVQVQHSNLDTIFAYGVQSCFYVYCYGLFSFFLFQAVFGMFCTNFISINQIQCICLRWLVDIHSCIYSMFVLGLLFLVSVCFRCFSFYSLTWLAANTLC